MNWNAKWINTSENLKDVCPIYFYNFSCKKPIIHAELSITAMGVYEAVLNENRVGDFVLALGWTAFDKRLQVQTYDITDLLQEENHIEVTVGKGWYRSPMPRGIKPERLEYLNSLPAGLTAEIKITYEDGETEHIYTDKSWKAAESQVRFSEIYDGEIFDASFASDHSHAVEEFEGPTHTLIPQQGEIVREQERVAVAGIFVTPKGETVVDFGQVVTGYVEMSIEASKGDRVRLSHAEVLDAEGNFYNENYRDAKCQYIYTCRDGKQTYKPKFTYCGFRYIRIEEFPGGADKAKPENFKAIAVYSQMERTGYIRCSDSLLNKLFDNIIWGQKGNFVDVPTDCPQRDERMGWTGDVQIFARAAALNYDVEKFFTKWLGDLAADQKEDGMVGKVVPDAKHHQGTSAGWGDVAVICPWILYQASIIDCLMNLPLLYWASKEVEDDRFKKIAIRHMDMALRDHIREDGSTNHIVDHELDKIGVKQILAGQGYAADSCWSRGLSWAVYGSVISYIHTEKTEYLEAAKKTADYFIEHCKKTNYLPLVDFTAPAEPVYYDSTAGVCAACGMLEIAKYVSEQEAKKYTLEAMNILKACDEAFCDYDAETDALVLMGTERYPHKESDRKGVHIPIIYGDFFFVEALLKLKGNEFFIW